MATKMVKSAQAPVLGNTVRDAITGYTGIAMQIVEMLGGTVQFCVQGRVDKSKLDQPFPGGENIDVHMLDFVDEGVAARVTVPTAPSVIQLGEKVKESVTGFVGVATSKHTFANGCVYFNVTPEMSKDDKEKGTAPQPSFFSETRLSKVDDGVVKKVFSSMSSTSGLSAGGSAPGGP